MNPLYNMVMGTGQQMPSYQQSFNTPVSRTNAIYQAMMNPSAFVQQAIPDLPPQIANDPNQILQYLQQTGRVTPQQIQEVANSIPRY